MKRKMKTGIITILFMTLFNVVLAQAPFQNGSSDFPEDLWHLKDVGIGSSDNPLARLHIFNGLSTIPRGNEAEPRANRRPFLVTGSLLDENQPPSQAIFPRDFTVTVDRAGYFGVDALNPYTKMHLRNGIFTISSGNLIEPSSNWQIHGNDKTFAIKDQLKEEYRFWINKSDGFVGVGTENPTAKLHVNDGLLNVENNGFTTFIGSQNSGFSHITTTAPKFYFNKDIYINGALSSYGSNDLLLQGNGTTGIRVKTDGKVVMGNTTITAGSHTDYKLAVDGKIVSKKVVVTLDNWADKVFDKNYTLKSLAEVENYIQENKHLPEIPSEAEVLENGIELGEMNTLLLQKVEELTLYMIQMEKEIQELKNAKQ